MTTIYMSLIRETQAELSDVSPGGGGGGGGLKTDKNNYGPGKNKKKNR
jgi:hypothetical protein